MNWGSLTDHIQERYSLTEEEATRVLGCLVVKRVRPEYPEEKIEGSLGGDEGLVEAFRYGLTRLDEVEDPSEETEE